MMDDDILSEARATLPIYVVADSPDGDVLSNRAGFPDDDTPVWIDGKGSPESPTPLGDLYAQYGDDLIAYADPEPLAVTAVTAAADAPKRTADGEVVVNPDAPSDPKLQLDPLTQGLLADIPDRIKAAEAKGDTAEVAALERYADALRAGKSADDARAEAWPNEAAAPAKAPAAPAPAKAPAPVAASLDPDAPSAADALVDAIVAATTQACGTVTASLALAVDEPAVDEAAAAAERQAIIDYAVANGWTEAQAIDMVTTGIVRTPDGTLFGVVLPDGVDHATLPDDVREMLDFEAQQLAAAEAQHEPGVTAAMVDSALSEVEAFLTAVEDKLGITAAINGPGIIPRPVQRMAVGENPQAQAQVLAAFEANYRDDVTEFVEDVLGPRPPDDTPEHDADAWDDLAAEARLWHAQRTGHAIAASLAAKAAAADEAADSAADEITSDIGDAVAAALTPDA